MKFKMFVLFSLVILTLGAVSASEDVAGDQNLTIADESPDALEESVNEEQVISEKDYSKDIARDEHHHCQHDANWLSVNGFARRRPAFSRC